VRTQGSGQSALLLLDAAALLEAEKIDYAVIGAMAASVHGVVRASLDADVVMSLTVQEAGKLEQKFISAGFKTQLTRGDPDDPVPSLLSLRDTFGNRVDLLAGLRGLEPAVFTRAIEIPFKDTRLRIAPSCAQIWHSFWH
jgi:hypothetical protein